MHSYGSDYANHALGRVRVGGDRRSQAERFVLYDFEEKEIPQEFLEVIEEKKEGIFKLTYTDQENLYIAVGYGVQQTGGYSISVNECYLTKNAVYFDTTLIGPSKGEQVNQVKSYPYLVIKTKYLEKSVVFE